MNNEHIILSGFADEIAENFDFQLETLNEFGVNFIELRSADGTNVSDFSDEKLAEVKEKLIKHNIKVSSIGSPIGKIDITEDFAPHFEKFKRIVKISKALQAQYIRIFSFFMPKDENPEIYHDEVMNRTHKMVDYAKEQGVVLLHENEKGIYGDNADRCLELMKEFYCDNYKVVFDFANFVECSVNTLEVYEMLKPYIEYIHIKDVSTKLERVVPAGQGDGNIVEILLNLKNSGYNGFLSMEPHLVDFGGFKALEKEAVEKDSVMDGKTAWLTALNALKAILWDINWR